MMRNLEIERLVLAAMSLGNCVDVLVFSIAVSLIFSLDLGIARRSIEVMNDYAQVSVLQRMHFWTAPAHSLPLLVA
jgi:hypothetical protein